jgi:hypothetical protein
MSRAAQIQDAAAGGADNTAAERAKIARRHRIAARGRDACDLALTNVDEEDVVSVLKAVAREACARIKARIGVEFGSFWGALHSTYVPPKSSKGSTLKAAERAFSKGAGVGS